MAASTYLLELQQRRHKLISDLADCIGFSLGSVEHEVAVDYAERSVTHHNRLDAQENQVEQTVCSVAEKLVMHGRVAQASQLLLLASRLGKNLIRLEGRRSVNPQAAEAHVPTFPPLEHPHAALSLLLSLSGPQRSSAKKEPCHGKDQPREQGSSAFAAGGMSDLSKFVGDSSRLWSSDSSSEERTEKEGSSHEMGGRLRQQVGFFESSQVHEDEDLQDWLQAFKSQGISDSDGSSAHTTDDEGYATDEHEKAVQVLSQPPPEIQSHQAEEPMTPPRRPVFRHNYGARCAGADIRSLADVAVDEVVPFIRPCQTLEACQSTIPVGLPRRRSVPEADVARAALHMLQGLPGDTFVLVQEAHELDNDCASRNRGFALSASAKCDLAVASLSPLALAGVLEEFIRLGNVAECLRAFVADAEDLPTPTASRNSLEEAKHGNTTQVFVACVKRHFEAFEDAIAHRGRRLYLRQRGLDSPEQSVVIADGRTEISTNWDCLSDESERDGRVSGETLLGLLSLLRPISESLKVIARLVEVTAGSWIIHPPTPRTPGNNNVGSLRERTGLLLAALYDSLVSDALLRRAVKGPPRLDDGALAPWRRGWHLNVFLEVLAPYLGLLDTWINEGRLLDPHGELFLSQAGGGSGFGECIDESAESYGLGNDSAVQIDRDLEFDSVVNMWGTGILLHSKALPPFLAPLASAVALAGHDVSLMRKARALIDSTPRDVFEGVQGAASGRKSWPSRTIPELGRESESLSLTTKLFDSLGHLANNRWNVDERESPSTVVSRQAVRRADAVDASIENRFDIEDDSDSSGDDMDSGTEDDPLMGFDDAEKANSSVIGDSNCVSEEDLSGREEGKGEGWDFNGCHGSLGDFGVDELTNEGQISAAAPAAAATSKSKSEELQGETNPGVVVEEALDSGHGTDEALQPESHMSAPQSLAARLSARFQRNSPSSSTLESDIDRQGFFWGTAQLALSPNAMLRKTLHPSIAPPSCLSISSRDTCVSGLLRERSSRLCGGEGARRVRDERVQLEKSVASAADAVAEVLPPSVVLESCVLSPLREHCRLTSSSCLGVFVEELEIAKIMGVLRAVYLCPSGPARSAPLSDFRAALFRLLGSLPSRAVVDSKAVAVSDGVRVVRDAAALLQDGEHMTSMLRLSLTVEERSLDEGELDATNQDGLAEESNGEICKRLRLPIVGSHQPLAEHFVVHSRPRTMRGWTKDGNKDYDGEAGSSFPFTVDRQSVDLRVFSSFQVECRLPWPFSVVLPPRPMDKYNCVLGLILKIDFTVHALEESHTLHRRGQQRHKPTATLKLQGLDTLLLQQTRLAAFLFVAKAVRRYVVSQASIKSWSEFVAQVPRCGSLRGFIRLHEAYLDVIKERCFLMPRDKRALEYLLDALQAGVAFSQRYREYVSWLDAASEGRAPGGYLQGDTRQQQEARELARKSLASLDELWKILFSAIGFFIPILKEMVQSRRAVHANELLMDLIFNDFFDFAWDIRGNRVASRVAGREGEANVSFDRGPAQKMAPSKH